MKKSSYKYTPSSFKENLPEWKRKKDPVTSRLIYRPLSFVTSSFLANHKISANTVSYFSIFIALASCILFVIPNRICNILGAICVNLWLLSDCTDGNIARSVKKQPFGGFADSVSSYILVAFLCTSISLAVYFDGGYFIGEKNIWVVFLGCLASTGDTLMRLVYQKYKSSEKELVDKGLIELENDVRTDKTQTNSLLVRIESDFGVGGILPIFILVGTIFNILDIVVLYCFMYYFLSSVVMIIKYIKKAITKTKEIEDQE